ncbi:MAG: A24 family peptidase [Pararhodobacter sp.]
MTPIAALLIAFLGAAMGSFAALVAERLVRGEGFVTGRSLCRGCGTPLRARDLVPLLSYPLLRGRCATCGAGIPGVLWHAEILGALIGMGALAVAPDPGRAALLAGWGWGLLALAVADLRWFRLPDALVLLVAALGLALVWAGDGSGWPPLGWRLQQAAIGALAGGGAFWLIRALYRWRTGRDGMGAGDVKLMAALGLALGAERLPLVVLVAALSALALSALRAWRKGRPLTRLGRVPFGAALALAAIVVALL